MEQGRGCEKEEESRYEGRLEKSEGETRDKRQRASMVSCEEERKSMWWVRGGERAGLVEFQVSATEVVSSRDQGLSRLGRKRQRHAIRSAL